MMNAVYIWYINDGENVIYIWHINVDKYIWYLDENVW